MIMKAEIKIKFSNALYIANAAKLVFKRALLTHFTTNISNVHDFKELFL